MEYLVSDRITFSDQIGFGGAYTQLQFGDTLALSDRNDQQTIRPSDTLALSDSITYSDVQTNFEIQDSISLSDSGGFLLTWGTAATDTLSLLDGITPDAGLLIGLSDTFSFSDGVAPFNYARQTDTISLSDAATTALAALPVIQISSNGQDTLSLSDSVNYSLLGALVRAGDVLPFLDGVSAILNSTTNAYLRRYLNDVR